MLNLLTEFEEFFAEYEKLALEMDKVFLAVQDKFPKEVTCKIGCCDCCYALFDLTLVEALYLKSKFLEMLDQGAQEEILKNADTADREVHRIKRRVFKERQKGVGTEEILSEVGKEKVRCPLLDDKNKCYLYEYRPITCRVYGIPTCVNGEVHTCRFSGFEPGGKYPTVYLDKIQDRLLDISTRLVQSMSTKYSKLYEVLVPVSMSLLTDYNEDYLGLPKKEFQGKSTVKEWSIGNGTGE